MNPVKLSKLLSFVLRHKPESLGLTINPHGWVMFDDLLAALQNDGHNITAQSIRTVVYTDDKKRYEMSPDNTMIRAVQGHSVKIDSTMFAVEEPPEFLYHGTALRFMHSITQQGLIAKQRHHVHLTDSIETAETVGKRYGTPVVLRIDAQRMRENGAEFYRAENGVWLIPSVPVGYFTIHGRDDLPEFFSVGDM